MSTCSRAVASFAAVIISAAIGGVRATGQPNMPRDYAIEVSASVQRLPAQIQLRWPADPRATFYQIFRKTLSDSAWRLLGDLPGSAAGFVDTDVVAGAAYEYGLLKKTTRELTGYGYIYAGIDLPLIEDRGKLVLVVEASIAGALAGELARLQQDITGDGWTVIRRDVSHDDSAAQVRSVIQAEYDADRTNVNAVLLFGHVPVAYSGNIAPDGHEQHRGAWPSDVFYADIDGVWTDSSVNSTNAEKRVNWNIPGDGKFDQSEPPTEVDLQVGRVDLSRLTAFSNKSASRSEIDLLRQYLDKNHRFRHGLIQAPRRALICDNFEDKGDDPVSNSGWRNFAAFFAAENVTEVGWGEYLPNTSGGSYLWSYGAGGGSSYFISAGVATSDDFATQDVQVIFTMFLGSFYGDWDNESNFLRSALGSGNILTASYSGFPHWHYQHMALGLPIGFSARWTQNIKVGGPYPPHNQGTHQVHIALMGDPTLRMHPVKPPSELNGTGTDSGVQLSWVASSESELIGYHVYRSSSPGGPFQRVSGMEPIARTSFTDPVWAGSFSYMVRAIKLEPSASGTYFNASQGITITVESNGGGDPSPPPVTPPASGGITISGAEILNGIVQIQVAGRTGQRYTVDATTDLRNWTTIASGVLRGSTLSLEVGNADEFGARFYRVQTAPSGD